MGEAAFVGRIGGLAAALGIGAAVLYGGCGAASADTTAQSGATPSSSTTSPAADDTPAPQPSTPSATETKVGADGTHTGSHSTSKQNKSTTSGSGRHGKPSKTTGPSATAGTDGEENGPAAAKDVVSQPDSVTPSEPSTPGDTAVSAPDIGLAVTPTTSSTLPKKAK